MSKTQNAEIETKTAEYIKNCRFRHFTDSERERHTMVNKKELGITSKLKAVPWSMFQMILLPAVFLGLTIQFCIVLHFEKWYDYIIILVNACITLRLTYTLITGIRLRNPNTKTIKP